MSDNAEYKNLVNQKSNAQSRYDSCSSRIEECEYLLGRLKPAKQAVAELKKTFKSNKKLDKQLHNEDHDWTGSTYQSFSSKMTMLTEANDNYYENSIDFVLDSLNNKITQIENQRLREYGLLGELGSLINSLANKIENFFN